MRDSCWLKVRSGTICLSASDQPSHADPAQSGPPAHGAASESAETALSDVKWQGFYVEAYVFVGVIYWGFCFFMSRYSQMLEREFSKGRR